MKLLLDENLSRRVIPFLLNSYPESTQVTLIGLLLDHRDLIEKILRQDGIACVEIF